MSQRAPIQRVLGFTFRPSHVARLLRYPSLAPLRLALVLAGYLYAQFKKQASRGTGVASWQVSRLRS